MSRPPLNDLLLPIETVNRELDGKLLLALFAAEAGFTAHVGPKGQIAATRFRPSIYVAKSVRFASHVTLMSQLGHKVVAWDEEGLVRFRDDIYGSRIEREAFSVPVALFSWGASNTEVWRRHPFYGGVPIVESGNPRIDLLRPELRCRYEDAATRLRERFGDFVLLNTNFGFINHFNVSGGGNVKSGSLDSDSYVKFKAQVDVHKRMIFEAFLSAIPQLAAAIAPQRLVIRPHPSENRAPWDKAAEGLANVSVVYEGAIAPWLLASSCVVHNGCTTAVEAKVMGRPALAYLPVVDPDVDIFLPNAVSEVFSDVNALGRRMREILDGRTGAASDAATSLMLNEHIAALDGPFACERIVQTLVHLRAPDQATVPPLARLSGLAKMLKRRINNRLGKDDSSYKRHKRGNLDFTVAEISENAGSFAQALNRFDDLVYEQRVPGIVTISKRPV